jgi:hypothetical protein
MRRPAPTLDRPGVFAQNKPDLKISRSENSLVSWAASAGARCAVRCPNGGSHDPQVDGSFAPANEIGRGRITNGPHSNLRPRRHERRAGARLRRSQAIERHRGRSVLCLYPLAEIVRGLPKPAGLSVIRSGGSGFVPDNDDDDEVTRAASWCPNPARWTADVRFGQEQTSSAQAPRSAHRCNGRCPPHAGVRHAISSLPYDLFDADVGEPLKRTPKLRRTLRRTV